MRFREARTIANSAKWCHDRGCDYVIVLDVPVGVVVGCGLLVVCSLLLRLLVIFLTYFKSKQKLIIPNDYVNSISALANTFEYQ